jgi:hypothetical protein
MLMRATVMYGAGDVRIETVPHATILEPTEAVVRITHAATSSGCSVAASAPLATEEAAR